MLESGEEIPETTLAATWASLERLAKDMGGWILLYELRGLCADPDHQPWGDSVAKLSEMGLVSPSGGVHSDIAAIVRGAVVGEGGEMRLENPVARKEPQEHSPKEGSKT